MTCKKNIAVILAGGVGSRVGLSTPKQFFKVAGKTVVEHTVDVFERNERIDEIAIVANPAYIDEFESMTLRNGWKKVKKILKGGKERKDSSLSAIYAYEGQPVNLVFHDAVRPLVSQAIVNRVLDALQHAHAIDVALPATDTIIRVDGDYIADIPDRSMLRRGQTPQAFDIEVIREAYDRAQKDVHFKTTDDCGVVRRYLPEEPIYVVAGEESNMKLTYKEDTFLLDKLFQLRQCEAHDLDQSAQELKGRVAIVFGGSYGIGAEIIAMLQEQGCRVFSFSRGQNGVDVGIREQVAQSIASVYAECGKIDYVINTAGLLNREPLATMDYQTILQAVQTNYMGTVNVALEAYQPLKESKGMLIFFTSSSYTRGRAFYSIYSSTKAAIVNFVQAVAQEWEGDGIAVNCINPERTATPMRTRNFGIEPPETLLTAKEVAQATLRTLCSSATGQVIDVKRKIN